MDYNISKQQNKDLRLEPIISVFSKPMAFFTIF